MKLKDKKVVLYKAAYDMDANGNQIEVFRPIHTGSLWAYYRQLSGTERFSAAGIATEEEAIFVVNWRADLSTDLLLKYKNTYYDITRIDDYEGYKTEIAIYAKIAARQNPRVG